eukprot:437613_1
MWDCTNCGLSNNASHNKCIACFTPHNVKSKQMKADVIRSTNNNNSTIFVPLAINVLKASSQLRRRLPCPVIHFKGFAKGIDFQDNTIRKLQSHCIQTLFNLLKNGGTLCWDGDAYKENSFTFIVPLLFKELFKPENLEKNIKKNPITNNNKKWLFLGFKKEKEKHKFINSWSNMLKISACNQQLSIHFECKPLTQIRHYTELGTKAINLTKSKIVISFGGGPTVKNEYNTLQLMKYGSNIMFYVYGVERYKQFPSLKSIYNSTKNIGYFDSHINKWSANCVNPIYYYYKSQNEKKTPNKSVKIRQFTEEEKTEFGIVHISQIRQREKMKSVGKIFDINVFPILSYLDQIAPAISPCLLYASGFCKFGHKCPCLNVNMNAHISKLSIQREFTWLKNTNDINIKINKIRTRKQLYDYCVVLDLEGLPEIIELPAILVDLKTFQVVSKFHKYVIPQQWIKENIFNKRIKKECRNDSSNAVSFINALNELNKWLCVRNKIDINERNSVLFAICGNWDIGKQIPLQCFRCNIVNKFPNYMYEWMNIKDFGLNFYGKKANKKDFSGMKSILKYLKIPLDGTHHSGMDDTSNITKIVLTYIKNGCVLQPTAKRNTTKKFQIEFSYPKNQRIGWGGN